MSASATPANSTESLTVIEHYEFALVVHSPASEIHHGQHYTYRGSVIVDRTEGTVSVSARGGGPDASGESADYVRNIADGVNAAGDEFALIPMAGQVPPDIFDNGKSVAEFTEPLVVQPIPHGWKVGGANRTVVVRDPVTGLVIRVDSYRDDLLVAVRSLVRVPLS